MPYVNLRVEYFQLRWNGSSWVRTGTTYFDISGGSLDPNIYYTNDGNSQNLNGRLFNATLWSSNTGKAVYTVGFASDILKYTVLDGDNIITASLANARFINLAQDPSTGPIAQFTRRWRFFNQNDALIVEIDRNPSNPISPPMGINGVAGSINNALIQPGSKTAEVNIGRLWSIANINPAVGNTGSEFIFYARIVNDLPPTYRPMSVTRAGVEKSCNRPAGMMSVMIGGKEVECRTTRGGTEGGDPPSYMSGGRELNQHKIGSETN